jgi:hypothetical protein
VAAALPLCCVVDTNVPTTANKANKRAPASCVAASASALQKLMQRGHLFVDDGGRIISEYRHNLSARGQPGPGDAFLKWVLTHEWSKRRVTRVPITAIDRGDGEDFAELPRPPRGIRYDPSDRKFLAVSAAHPKHPPVWQSFDSKWWGWRKALHSAGIIIHFLCEREIAHQHAKKIGTS